MQRGLHTMRDLIKKTPYGKELERSEWEAFSDAVRKAKNNSCEICRQGNRVTQVHHVFYDFNRKPWEYSHDEVILLCEHCHKSMHHHLKIFRRYVFGKLTPQSFRVLNAALAVAFHEYDGLTFVHALAEFVSNPGLLERHKAAWEKDPKHFESWAKTFLFQDE